jgi:DHA2 family multidrug resistance protein-like MFS transporter
LLLPEYRNPDAGRLDLFSVGLSLLAVLPFIYGIKETARSGWAPGPVVALVIGAVFGVLFVRRQHQLADPMLDLGLFKIRVYRSALVLGLLLGIIAGGTLLLINLQLQMVEGLSPLRTGLWLVPGVIGMVLAIMVSTGLARKIRPAYLMAAGFAVSAAGYAVLSQVPSTHGLPTIVVGSFLAATGVGPTVALGYGMILGSAPPEKTGAATGLSETSGEFGVAAGIAILGTIGAAVYRHQISVPAGLPTDAATTARESIANAVAVAQQLSGPVADQLLTSARQAFTSGLNVVGVLAAVLSVALAGLAVLWLHQVPTTSELSSESDVVEPDPSEPEPASDAGAGTPTLGNHRCDVPS